MVSTGSSDLSLVSLFLFVFLVKYLSCIQNFRSYNNQRWKRECKMITFQHVLPFRSCPTIYWWLHTKTTGKILHDNQRTWVAHRYSFIAWLYRIWMDIILISKGEFYFVAYILMSRSLVMSPGNYLTNNLNNFSIADLLFIIFREDYDELSGSWLVLRQDGETASEFAIRFYYKIQAFERIFQLTCFLIV